MRAHTMQSLANWRYSLVLDMLPSSSHTGGSATGLSVPSALPEYPFSASSRLFDLNGETDRIRKRKKSAIIAVDVRRFGHAINTDEVFGTHTGQIPGIQRISGYRDYSRLSYGVGDMRSGLVCEDLSRDACPDVVMPTK